MRLNKLKLSIVAALAVFSGNALAEVNVQKHASLSELASLEYTEENKSALIQGAIDSEDVRLKEVRNTALALGAQHGYIKHMNFLKTEIDQSQNQLEKTFDFNTLMKLTGSQMEELYFLPPVISEVNNMATVSENARRIKISETMYSIDKPGRLVTTAPNWRQYLLFDQPIKVSKPMANLLPRDSREKELWQNWIQEGWFAGYEQAEMEMTYRVRKLGQDFKGMAKYLRLVSEGLINKPVIVSSSQDVIGGGSEMRINEQIIQLAIPAQLNSNENDWEALILDGRGSLRYPDEARSSNNKRAENQ